MIALPLVEGSQVADARRRAQGIARDIGLDDVAAGRVGIVATELATNLVKYAAGGEVLLDTYEDEAGIGVEVIALDKGPGITDLRETMRDGYSTTGSPGTGLGAVRRLCRDFDMISWPAVGTGLLARIGAGPVAGAARPAWGQVVVPLAGEPVSGDAVCTRPHRDGWIVFVADGLGHGPQAAHASSEAIRAFLSVEHLPPTEILKAVHAGIRHTRGAAVAVCRYCASEALVHYAGVGNVEGRVVDGGETKRLVSHAGTVGLTLRRVQDFAYPFPPGSTLVMHSDGVSGGWAASSFPGLLSAHPSLAAAVIYKHHARSRDDAAVAVAHAAPAPS